MSEAIPDPNGIDRRVYMASTVFECGLPSRDGGRRASTAANLLGRCSPPVKSSHISLIRSFLSGTLDFGGFRELLPDLLQVPYSVRRVPGKKQFRAEIRENYTPPSRIVVRELQTLTTPSSTLLAPAGQWPSTGHLTAGMTSHNSARNGQRSAAVLRTDFSRCCAGNGPRGGIRNGEKRRSLN